MCPPDRSPPASCCWAEIRIQVAAIAGSRASLAEPKESSRMPVVLAISIRLRCEPEAISREGLIMPARKARRSRNHRNIRASKSDLRTSHRQLLLSRQALLAGPSVLALVLSAPQGASARPLGNYGAAFSATTNTSASAITSAQQAAAATQQSIRSLTRAIQAMQAVQATARNLAASGPTNLGADPNHPGLRLPNVPNGLSAGGLMPDSGLAGAGGANAVTSWVNASTPTQATANGRTNVTIQQTSAQALLNWATFNVGKSTTVNFNQQGHAGWIALHRIH